MRTVIDTLQPEGTSRYEVLLFVCAKSSHSMPAVEASLRASLGDAVHSIVSYEEERNIAVVELRTKSRADVGDLILYALRSACASIGVAGAMCVIEGHYAGWDHTLASDKWAPRGVYAFCVADDEPVICLSGDFLASAGWRNIVTAAFRARLSA